MIDIKSTLKIPFAFDIAVKFKDLYDTIKYRKIQFKYREILDSKREILNSKLRLK